MPIWAALSKVGFSSAKRMAIGTANFSIQEEICPAVSELPVAHGSLGDVDAEGYAGGEDTYQCCSEPSLTRHKDRAKEATYTTLSVNRPGLERIFDLCLLALGILRIFYLAYQIMEPIYRSVVIVWKAFANGSRRQQLLLFADMGGDEGLGIGLPLYCTKPSVLSLI